MGFAGTKEEKGDLVKLGNRFYDPEIGRFIQADPVQMEATPLQAQRLAELSYQSGAALPTTSVEDGLRDWAARVFSPQGLNRYSYVLNNPLNVVDIGGYSAARARFQYQLAEARRRQNALGAKILGWLQVGFQALAILSAVAPVFAPIVFAMNLFNAANIAATITAVAVVAGAATTVAQFSYTWATTGSWALALIAANPVSLAFSVVGLGSALYSAAQQAMSYFSSSSADAVSRIDTAGWVASSDDVVPISREDKTSIYVGYKKIGKVPGKDAYYYHAFVYVQGSKEHQVFIMRAGPGEAGNGLLGVSLDTLGSESSDAGFGSLTVDFQQAAKAIEFDGAPIRWQLVHVTGRDFNSVWQDLLKFGNAVNKSNIPYMPLSTNSNAFAFQAIESLGIVRPTPDVWVPGYNTNLPLK